MLFVLSSLVVVTGGVLVAATLRLGSACLWVLTVALVWNLHIVVVGRLLDPLDLLGSRTAWLVADPVFVVVAVIVWRRAGSPTVLPSIPPGAVRDMLGTRWLRPATIGLALFVTAIYAVLLAATLLIPQNLDDVLTAYTARVGYWMQHGNLSPFPTSTYNSVQVSYPVNAQLPILRSIVLSGGSRFVGLEQWAASLLGAVGVFGLSRALGAKRCAAYICGAAWLLIPAVAIQAGIALTDLVSVWLVLATLLFGYLGWEGQRRSMLVLSAIALGLAVGTKQTILFLGPGLVAASLAALVTSWHRRRDWVTWVGLSIPIVVLLGCVDYLRNWSHFGHPLGEPESFELFAVDATISQRLSAMSTNVNQAAADIFFGDLNPGVAVHLPGLWRVQSYDPVIGTGGYLEHGQPWMGFFVASTMLVGVLLALYQVVHHRRHRLLVALVPAVTFVAIIFWTRTNYSGAFSRYVLIPGALCLAVSGAGLSALSVRSRLAQAFRGLTAVLVVAGMGFQASYTVANNGVRPLVGHGDTWSAPPIDLLEFASGYSNLPDIVASLRYFEACFGDVDRVGIMLPSKFPQATLFGDGFSRTVLQFAAPFPRHVGAQFLETNRVRVLFVETDLLKSVVVDQDQLQSAEFGTLRLVSLIDPGTSEC